MHTTKNINTLNLQDISTRVLGCGLQSAFVKDQNLTAFKVILKSSVIFTADARTCILCCFLVFHVFAFTAAGAWTPQTFPHFLVLGWLLFACRVPLSPIGTTFSYVPLALNYRALLVCCVAKTHTHTKGTTNPKDMHLLLPQRKSTMASEAVLSFGLILFLSCVLLVACACWCRQHLYISKM